MKSLTPEEQSAISELVNALEVAGDGDIKKGAAVFKGVLKLPRTTGEDDPEKGVERIRDALNVAYRAEAMARVFKWLALALVALIMLGAQAIEGLQKIFAGLRAWQKL